MFRIFETWIVFYLKLFGMVYSDARSSLSALSLLLAPQVIISADCKRFDASLPLLGCLSIHKPAIRNYEFTPVNLLIPKTSEAHQEIPASGAHSLAGNCREFTFRTWKIVSNPQNKCASELFVSDSNSAMCIYACVFMCMCIYIYIYTDNHICSFYAHTYIQ